MLPFVNSPKWESIAPEKHGQCLSNLGSTKEINLLLECGTPNGGLCIDLHVNPYCLWPKEVKYSRMVVREGCKSDNQIYDCK